MPISNLEDYSSRIFIFLAWPMAAASHPDGMHPSRPGHSVKLTNTSQEPIIQILSTELQSNKPLVDTKSSNKQSK